MSFLPLIVSNDTIMKPPYDITSKILSRSIAIAEKLGEVKTAHLHRPSIELRKQNRIKTIQASLEIEGNTLTEEQITAILENKRVIGSKKDITEVLNAIEVYDKLPKFKPTSLKSFLKAHKILMKDLIKSPGKLRKKAVGIAKGKEIAHIAPPAANLNFLMKDLFGYLKHGEDSILIKSCVVHYEIEFIHPFLDGNGRMGRLWQSLILLKTYPVFEFLPFETIIKDRQSQYYQVLGHCDKVGKSTLFIEFILEAINQALGDLLNLSNRTFTQKDRIIYFLSTLKNDSFTRKDYLRQFKEISTATASRDLKYGVENGYLIKIGEKRMTQYKIK